MKRKAQSFYPVHYYWAWMIAILLLALLVTLGIYYPHSLIQKADPFTMPKGRLLPPWYFVPIFEMMELLPEHYAETIGFLLLLLFWFWPFIDRGKARHFSRRKLSAFLGGIVLLAYLGLMLWAKIG